VQLSVSQIFFYFFVCLMFVARRGEALPIYRRLLFACHMMKWKTGFPSKALKKLLARGAMTDSKIFSRKFKVSAKYKFPRSANQTL
jgi:hypothetical protein